MVCFEAGQGLQRAEALDDQGLLVDARLVPKSEVQPSVDNFGKASQAGTRFRY